MSKVHLIDHAHTGEFVRVMCGMRAVRVTTTNDIEDVTCQRCVVKILMKLRWALIKSVSKEELVKFILIDSKKVKK